MKYLNRLSAGLVIAAIAVGTLAQQATPTSLPSVERLRAHVEYLASDKLEGRRTGTAGANLAAQYIAREFSRLGLRRSIGHDLPGMSILEADSPNRYLQKFPYVAGVELGKGNLLAARFPATEAPIDLRIGEDWMPLGFSPNSQVAGAAAVFANYGIVAADLKRDDYAGLEVKDKVVIALTGTPDRDNPHGQFAKFEDPRWKAIAAKNLGAKALVLLSQEENFSDERLTRLRYDNAGEAGLPVIVVSKPASIRLLRALVTELFGDSSKSKCGTATKMADGTEVSQCTKFKLILFPDGHRELEFLDGSRGTVGPDGTFKLDKFYGPEELKKFSWSVNTDLQRREVAATNVIGILDGSDPTLKNETIVIGAHYDHLGHGGSDSLSTKEGIHHGADDNASGVAGVLELARIFSQQQPRPKRTIVFMAFSGEEEGLLGSNYYVNHPILPLANTVAMINMDMIGRMKDGKLTIGGVGTSPEWRPLTEQANLGFKPHVIGAVSPSSASAVKAVMGSDDPKAVNDDRKPQFSLTLNEDGFGPSDHSSFYAKQIPVLFFWTGTHEDYHKPSDTADKINYDGESRIVAMVADIVRNLDGSDKRPAYSVAKSEATGRSMGFRVYLGTIPNYADSTDGLLLDGVREDSPASKAGLKAGDKIVKLAGRDVKNVYDYTSALGEMKAGQEYEAEVLRAGERVTLKITPAARK